MTNSINLVVMIYKYGIIGVIVLFSMVALSVYAEYASVKMLIPTDKIEITDNVVVTKRPNTPVP